MQYNDSLYNSLSLRKYAKRFLEHVPEDTDFLISSGASGCAIASAMLCLSEFELRHVHYYAGEPVSHHDKRKKEASGAKYELKHVVPDPKCVLVDDGIDSGNTILATSAKLPSDCTITAVIAGCDWGRVQMVCDTLKAPVFIVDDGEKLTPKEKT